MGDDKLSDLYREILIRELMRQSPPVAPTKASLSVLSRRRVEPQPVPISLSALSRRRLLAPPQNRPRIFVGFSSTDKWQFTQMLGWKAHEDIDVDFADCQLDRAVASDNEQYIKSVCRQHLQRAGTFVQLIGEDTARKHKYVRWEAEVAIEKECRIIAVNLDGWWDLNPATCPPILRNVGAMFVPFSPAIVGFALEGFERRGGTGYWYYPTENYERLGYDVIGKFATYRQRPRPWQR